MKLDPASQKALESAWNNQAAYSSLERWLGICTQEKWGNIPRNLPLLITLFGVSWYFTRYVFYRGSDAVALIDQPFQFEQCLEDLLRDFREHGTDRDFEDNLHQLSLLKNEIMMQILLAQLKGEYDQAMAEQALTRLAEAVLQVMILLCGVDRETKGKFVVLGMGRIAGLEMTYGSDLDLIILSLENSQDAFDKIGRAVRRMLRMIATVDPAGSLYEIDMRLRPHGNAGTLISPLKTFIEYHTDTREIWERQMMTRCRPVAGDQHLSESVLKELMPHVYARYDDNLRSEVIRMRKLVQHELGSPAGKYDIKRGKGGTMDIDFITHYLQLLHGHTCPALQTASTRGALRELGAAKLLDANTASLLLDAYDFLKLVESRLRVFDMKSISQFSRAPEENIFIARAMGFLDEKPDEATEKFLEKYLNVTDSVRQKFQDIVGWDEQV